MQASVSPAGGAIERGAKFVDHSFADEPSSDEEGGGEQGGKDGSEDGSEDDGEEENDDSEEDVPLAERKLARVK